MKLKDPNTRLPSIRELRKISVRISRTDDKGNDMLLGTGTIAFDGVDYYVLTAAHCFRDEAGNDNCQMTDINLTLYDDDDKAVTFKPYDWWKSSVEDDAAWLKIDNPHNGFDFLHDLKLLGTEIDDEACVYGYTEGIQNGYKFIYQMKNLGLWCCNDKITENGAELYDTIKGSSGGGLFIKVDDTIYCMGYVKKVFDKYSKLDNVMMFPIKNFRHNWSGNFINSIEEVIGIPVRVRECNEMKAQYTELWNRLYNEIYNNQDISTTLKLIKDAKKQYPIPKNVRQQEQVVSLLFRKQEDWKNSYQEAFLIALQDRGLWLSLFGPMPKKAGNLEEHDLCKIQEERGVTLLAPPYFEGEPNSYDEDSTTYEKILRAAYSFDFTTMRVLLNSWKANGLWMVRKSFLQNLFGKDEGSIAMLKELYQDFGFDSQDEKFLTATSYNLATADFRNRISYQDFWDKGIEGISDVLLFISGNIDKQKEGIGIYGIHHTQIFGDGDQQSFPESLRLVQTIINTGMVPSMNSIAIISKENWMKTVRHQLAFMPYPIVFYTLTYTDEKLLRRVAQEICYTENERIRAIMPDLMIRLLGNFKHEDLPKNFGQGILYMTKEWYVAVAEEVWYEPFKNNVMQFFCHDIPTENVSHMDALYVNIEEAVKYIMDTSHRKEIMTIVLEVLNKNAYLVNGIIESMMIDDELLKDGEVIGMLVDLVRNHPLKDTCRIIYKVVTSSKIGSILKEQVDNKVYVDAFDFGIEAGVKLGMLSYIFKRSENITRIKQETLKLDMWYCGIKEKRYTDPRPAHLEMFNPDVEWTNEEWEAIKANIYQNIELIHQDRPERDSLQRHFNKQYIDLLSNMKYFVNRMSTHSGSAEVLERVDSVMSGLRGYNNVVEALSSDDYDKVVDGVWYLRDLFVDKGAEYCKTETMLLINKILMQKPVALESCMSLLAAMVYEKPEDMTRMYDGLLVEILKRYCREFDYESLFVSVPAMYKWLRMIARALNERHSDDASVKWWMEDAAAKRFNETN